MAETTAKKRPRRAPAKGSEDRLAEAIVRTFETTRGADDYVAAALLGVPTYNVADGLIAIARALDRIADALEAERRP